MLLQIVQDFIPLGRANRPAYSMLPEGQCWHETGSFAVGANAKSHAIYIKSDACANRPASWHLTVDSKPIVYQHLPFNESGWHAGDGSTGRGNRRYIGIELCVNADGDFEQTLRHGIWVGRHLNKTVPNLVLRIKAPDLLQQHWNFSAKNCPQRIRTEGRWNWFVNEIMKEEGVDNIMFDTNVKVKIKTTATNYATGEPIPLANKGGKIFTISKMGSPWGTTIPSALLSEITSWVRVTDLELANPPVIVCGSCVTKDSKIEELAKKVTTLEAKIKLQDNSIASLVTQVNSQKAIIDKERLDYATLKTSKDELANQLTGALKTLAEMQKANEAQAKSLISYERLNKDKDLIILELNQFKVDYAKKIEVLENQVKDQSNMVTQLSGNLTNLNEKYEDLQEKNIADSESLLKLSTDNSTLRNLVDKLSGELKEANKPLWDNVSTAELFKEISHRVVTALPRIFKFFDKSEK
jgi:uncharacterized coiled-coil protein SlyX